MIDFSILFNIIQRMTGEYRLQYQQFNPLERNAELLAVFMLIPAPLERDYDKDEDWISRRGTGAALDQLQRRRGSEVKNILTERLSGLLSFAPITSALQLDINGNYEAWYIHGMDKINIPFVYEGVLFKDHSISPGIFEENSAKDIERQIYRQTVFGKLEVIRMMEELYKRKGLEPPDLTKEPPYRDYVAAIFRNNPNKRFDDPDGFDRDMERTVEEIKKEKVIRNRWPIEFFELHGEEI